MIVCVLGASPLARGSAPPARRSARSASADHQNATPIASETSARRGAPFPRWAPGWEREHHPRRRRTAVPDVEVRAEADHDPVATGVDLHRVEPVIVEVLDLLVGERGEKIAPTTCEGVRCAYPCG
jgi:hypothetical protein